MTPAGRGVRRGLIAVTIAAWIVIGYEQFDGRAAIVAPTPPPAYSTYRDPAGASRVHWDSASLTAWCTKHGVPAPPPLEGSEPEVAEAFRAALLAAVSAPSAATIGHLGMVFESLDCHEQAELCFIRAARRSPEDARWPYYLGCIYQITGNTAQAIASFESASRLDRDYALTHARLAQLHLDTENWAAAEQHARVFVAERPQDSLGYVHLARVALARDDARQALVLGEQAIQRNPQDFQAHYVLGQACSVLGRPSEADRHFEQCSRLPRGGWFAGRDPLDAELHATTPSVARLTRQFQARLESNDWPALIELGEEIIRRRPDDIVMLANLAALYRKIGQLEQAMAMVDRAAALSPEAPLVGVRRAEILLTRKAYAAALTEAQTVLERAPNMVAALSVSGRAQLMLGRATHALPPLEACVKHEPDNLAHLAALGEAYWALNRLDAAEAVYRRMLERQPGHPHAIKRIQDIAAARSR